MAVASDARPVVVGAGPGGAAAALFLAKVGRDVVVVDKATFPRDKICGDALSGKVVEVLNALDPSLTNAFRQLPAQVGSWGIRFVAPSGRDLRVPFKLQYDTQAEAPGFVAPRLDFDSFLVEQLRRHARIELREGVGVDTATLTAEGTELALSDGTLLTTPIAIGADGAHSVLAKQLAGYRMVPRHHSAGLRQYWQGVQGLDDENFVELHFLKDLLPGYLWVFPLPGGRANVGLGLRSDVIARKRLNIKTLLADLLQRVPELKERFRNAEPLEPPRGFGLPLGSKRWPLSGDGFLLVGDAGSLIDPFSGEGIGNALKSGQLAAAHIAQHTGVFSAAVNKAYDRAVWQRLGGELRLGSAMQRLVERPWLFNLVVAKAHRSKALRETITCMFDDIDLRGRLSNPLFYLRLLFA